MDNSDDNSVDSVGLGGIVMVGDWVIVMVVVLRVMVVVVVLRFVDSILKCVVAGDGDGGDRKGSDAVLYIWMTLLSFRGL